jgi:hypothetical protein
MEAAAWEKSFYAAAGCYLTRIITSPVRQPIVQQIASTRSRERATIVTKERVGM